MWRDPLDELIDDLDRLAPPPSPANPTDWLVDFLRYSDIVLYGSDQARERLKTDPQFHEHLARLAVKGDPADT